MWRGEWGGEKKRKKEIERCVQEKYELLQRGKSLFYFIILVYIILGHTQQCVSLFLLYLEITFDWQELGSIRGE